VTHNEAFAAPSLLRRLTAMLYDMLLVVSVVAGVFALALIVQVKLLGSAGHVLHPAVAQALTVASVYGFFIVFWLMDGQTLGMRAWRMKLVDFNGESPTLGKLILRCCGATLSALCLGIGYLWCLIDRRNRYWHDYLSQTELILLPPRTKESDKVT